RMRHGVQQTPFRSGIRALSNLRLRGLDRPRAADGTGAQKAVSKPAASFRNLRNLFRRGSEHAPGLFPPAGDRERAVSLLWRPLFQAGSRRHRRDEPGLSGLRLPRVAVAQRRGIAAAVPLRLGSPAQPLRVTTLTPPK